MSTTCIGGSDAVWKKPGYGLGCSLQCDVHNNLCLLEVIAELDTPANTSGTLVEMCNKSKTVNGVPIKEILNPAEDDPAGVEWIPGRSTKAPPLVIVGPDPKWPEYFEIFKSRILAAFGETVIATTKGEGDESCDTTTGKVTILDINHVGSTAVPDLPAKAIIDIDLILSSNRLESEPFYVPRLKSAGFEFRLREKWYEHRFFQAWEPMTCNLHVWGGLGNAQVERHKIFRDWLCGHDDDRELYASVKRECAELARENGNTMRDYTQRKDWVVREIMVRACEEVQG